MKIDPEVFDEAAKKLWGYSCFAIDNALRSLGKEIVEWQYSENHILWSDMHRTCEDGSDWFEHKKTMPDRNELRAQLLRECAFNLREHGY